MVNATQIRTSNSKIDSTSALRVAVFVGATSGIGKLTLAELVGLGTQLKTYVIGRQRTEAAYRPVIEEWRHINPKAEIIWIEGEVTLLAEVKRICKTIQQKENSIDLLFMTVGYPPFAGRQDTTEGIEATQALQYYSRILFIISLLPLLRAASHARVISVLAGGMENAAVFNVEDLNLDQPGAFGPIASQQQVAHMGSITLERLAEAEENRPIVFIHSYPGAVRTGNLARGWKEGSWIPFAIGILSRPLFWVMGFGAKESGERHLYMATSGAFGGIGPQLPAVSGQTTKGDKLGGIFLVNHKCDTVRNEGQMEKLRLSQQIVWDKTEGILSPYMD